MKNEINDEFNLGLEDFLLDATNLLKQANETNLIGLLKVQSANKWIEEASSRPIPKMLFAEFWHEGELCILFASTNLGKSILAVQIADSISKGEAIPGFKFEAEKQPILYFDFEMSDKQFENRYSINYCNHYIFDDDFKRVEINTDVEFPEKMTFEDFLVHSIERAIIETNAKILLVDNVTYLRTETEKAKDALLLMKLLKRLKSKYGLSILVLAHTPKRDLSRPLTRNDLMGSSALMQFCDSSFAIGESHLDKHLRYLKQIKARNTAILYDSENVCICQITKPDNFLQFEVTDFGMERNHLKERTEKDVNITNAKILELSQEGKSLREISKIVGISHMSVRRFLEKQKGSQEQL